MLHNITQQCAVNVKGATGTILRKFPKKLPIKNSCILTETNVPRVSITEVGTVSFNNTELFNLLNKNNTQVRITLDILYRAPENSQELNKETSTHLKRMYLFSTISNKRLSIDCDGVNIILYIDGSTPKIKTETINYYKIDIENLTIYESADIIYAKSDIYNCIDTSVKTWTQSNITSQNFNCCYYANGVWVAGSFHGKGLYYSTDGKTWTQSNITSINFNHCYYANCIWVACSKDKGLYYSTDGKTWTKSSIPSISVVCCYYANGIWVACSSSNGLYYSTDGITWALGTIDIASEGFYHCYYANSIWVACSNSNGLYYSTDGITWTLSTIGNFRYCYYANSIWVACGYNKNGLLYSTDGKTWSTNSNIDSDDFYRCYYANCIWVACSYNTGLYYSTDGKTWAQSNITSNKFYCCYYANGVWIACGYNTGLYYSTDGKNWIQSNITSNTFYCCYYANGIWVTSSYSNKGLYFSTVNQYIIGPCKWGLQSNMPEVSPGSPGNSGVIVC